MKLRLKGVSAYLQGSVQDRIHTKIEGMQVVFQGGAESTITGTIETCELTCPERIRRAQAHIMEAIAFNVGPRLAITVTAPDRLDIEPLTRAA